MSMPSVQRAAFHRLLFAVTSISLVFGGSAFCDDAGVAKQLEGLGGKVTLKDGKVTQVSFTDCDKLGDAEFRTLGGLVHLKSLTLYGGKQRLTDDTVGHLLSLQELESLSSEGARLTDSGVAKLAGLKKLKSASFFHLSFRLDGFKGTGFSAWKDLPQFERLTVAGMSAGDEMFSAISQIRTLKDLSTWHTYQTEAGNVEIAKLPNLASLKVGQRLPRPGAKEPSLSDASIPTIASIKTIENLKLTEGRFTFEALRGLKALPKLQKLLIAESDISDGDVAKLRAELPNVKIDHQPLTDEQRKRLENYLK